VRPRPVQLFSTSLGGPVSTTSHSSPKELRAADETSKSIDRFTDVLTEDHIEPPGRRIVAREPWHVRKDGVGTVASIRISLPPRAGQVGV